MKRFFIFTLLFCALIINASPVFNRVTQDSGDDKNQFFPMKAGQVREFSKEENGAVTTCTWKVDGVFQITDEDNKLQNQEAYQFTDSSNGEYSSSAFAFASASSERKQQRCTCHGAIVIGQIGPQSSWFTSQIDAAIRPTPIP